MKSITEIMGGMQILFGISFDIQKGFEEYLTHDQQVFLSILRVLEAHMNAPEETGSHFGRLAYDQKPCLSLHNKRPCR